MAATGAALLPRVVSVFVGAARPLGPGRSGIVKAPIAGPVDVLARGLVGDDNVERPESDMDQAVCAYPIVHYGAWRARFDAIAERFAPGALGENLSVSGLVESEACIGDVYRVGTAVLEVSKPRGPCRKVGLRIGVPEFAGLMRRSLRTGWYLCVVEPGTLHEECTMVLVERPSPGVTVRVVAEAMYLRRADLMRAVEIAACDALAQNWRDVFAARIAGRPEPPL